MVALVPIDWHLVWTRIVSPNGVFAHALWATVYISIVAQIMGILLGLLAALMRMSRLLPFRFLSGFYVLVFRGTPVLVQIMFFWLVLPGPRIFNFGAFHLGMRSGLAMRRIVLPQAARVIVPPLGNEFNNMMKTSSLVYIIGVYEMFSDAEQAYSTALAVAPFIAVAFWYFILTSIWSFAQALIERKLAVSEHGDEISLRDRAIGIWTEGGGMVRSAWPWRARA